MSKNEESEELWKGYAATGFETERSLSKQTFVTE